MRRGLMGLAAIALGLVIPSSVAASEVTLYNHSFEEPKLTVDPEKLPKPTGWIWTGDVDTGTTFERVEDPEAPDGDWVLKVDSSGFEGLGGVHSPSLDVAPGQDYTIRMMVKVPPGRPLWRAISERKANDEQLVFDEAPVHVGTGEWELLEYTRFFETGEKIRGYWRMGGGNEEPGTFYLDAVPPPEPEPEPTDLGDAAIPPPLTTLPDPAPRVSAFGLVRRRFASVGGQAPRRVKRGTRFTYTLSEPARVTIVITRRRLGKVKTLRAQEQAGPQSTAFSGRGQRWPLPAGSYRAKIVATDTAGQISEPRYANFRVVGG